MNKLVNIVENNELFDRIIGLLKSGPVFILYTQLEQKKDQDTIAEVKHP